jgi:hypothetical protein
MASEEALGVDALTLVDSTHLEHYLDHPPYAAFVMKNQPAEMVDAADRGGFYWVPSSLFTLLDHLGEIVQVRVAGTSVLYDAQGEDFAAQLHKAIKRLR